MNGNDFSHFVNNAHNGAAAKAQLLERSTKVLLERLGQGSFVRKNNGKWDSHKLSEAFTIIEGSCSEYYDKYSSKNLTMSEIMRIAREIRNALDHDNNWQLDNIIRTTNWLKDFATKDTDMTVFDISDVNTLEDLESKLKTAGTPLISSSPAENSYAYAMHSAVNGYFMVAEKILDEANKFLDTLIYIKSK